LTPQLRRSSVSVMLNYVEGYGRMKEKSKKHFYRISYASLKESIYIVFLAKELKYIPDDDYKKIFDIKDKIGAMIYSIVREK